MNALQPRIGDESAIDDRSPQISLTNAEDGRYRLQLEAILPLSEVTRLLSAVQGHLAEETRSAHPAERSKSSDVM